MGVRGWEVIIIQINHLYAKKQKKKTGWIKFLSYRQSPSGLSLSFIHITMLYCNLFYLTLYSATDYNLPLLVHKSQSSVSPCWYAQKQRDFTPYHEMPQLPPQFSSGSQKSLFLWNRESLFFTSYIANVFYVIHFLRLVLFCGNTKYKAKSRSFTRFPQYLLKKKKKRFY